MAGRRTLDSLAFVYNIYYAGSRYTIKVGEKSLARIKTSSHKDCFSFDEADIQILQFYHQQNLHEDIPGNLRINQKRVQESNGKFCSHGTLMAHMDFAPTDAGRYISSFVEPSVTFWHAKS